MGCVSGICWGGEGGRGLVSRFEGGDGGFGRGVVASYLYIPSAGMSVEPRDREERREGQRWHLHQ